MARYSTLDGNSGNVYSGAAIVTKDVPADMLARLERLRNPHEGEA